MMIRIKQTLSYILYYIGHWISHPMAKYDLGVLYPLYNWCMIKSSELDVNEKLWRKPHTLVKFETVNRVELIDDIGRVYVKHLKEDEHVQYSLQDNQQTLKIFVGKKND